MSMCCPRLTSLYKGSVQRCSGFRRTGRSAALFCRCPTTRCFVVTCGFNKPDSLPKLGNVNRIAPEQHNGNPVNDAIESLDYQGSPTKESSAQTVQQPAYFSRLWGMKLESIKGRLLYSYYNWRQDTLSDLVLFSTFNLMLLILGGWFQGNVIRSLDSSVPQSSAEPLWWGDFYSVMVWMLGEDLPSREGSGLASQMFAIATVVLGLVSFALVLALVEQVVLEVLERNVRRGSQVYEEGHIVVLAWGESAYDLSQLIRVLGQACHAFKYKNGSNAVVVLTQDREKLEMESYFRRNIPEDQRLGTKFVFRQGSPLDPLALQMVAATKARAVILTADSSRSSADSDGQCLRAAVLLDELIDADSQRRDGRGPSIVFQVQNPESLATVNYACSNRVIPVPAYGIQARRLARIVRNPVSSIVSNMMGDYRSGAHLLIYDCPSLVGVPFKDLHFHFPSSIVIGYISSTGRAKLNPPADRVLKRGHQLVLMSHEAVDSPVGMLPHAVAVDIGGWSPDRYTLKSQDEEPLGVDVSNCLQRKRIPRQHSAYCQGSGRASATYEGEEDEDEDGISSPLGNEWGFSLPRGGPQKSNIFILPLQYSSSLLQASDVLICGWGRSSFMWTLLQELDHGPQALPEGSSVTLLNEHEMPDGLESACKCNVRGISSLKIKHIKADPRNMFDLRTNIEMRNYKAVIVLTDVFWNSPDSKADDSWPYAVDEGDMLRMDAAVLLVQLNIRAILEAKNLPDISIVVQRQTFIGNTRFEDATRLPLGLPVNSASFIGKMLTQTAFQPFFLKPYVELGLRNDFIVQDSSAFAADGEELSFMQLQARAISVHQIIVGYYTIPSSGFDAPLEVMVNPRGLEVRTAIRVWNKGDSRCKLITLVTSATIKTAQSHSESNGSTASSSSGGFSTAFSTDSDGSVGLQAVES